MQIQSAVSGVSEVFPNPSATAPVATIIRNDPLAALRVAMEIAQANLDTIARAYNELAGRTSVTTQTANAASNWHAAVLNCLEDGRAHTTAEIASFLKAQGESVSYGNLTSWLGRAVKQGKFRQVGRGTYRLEKH